MSRTIAAIEADLTIARNDHRFCGTPTVKRTAALAISRFEAERQAHLDAIVQRANVVPADPNADRIARLEAEIAALKATPVKATAITPVKVDVQPPLKGRIVADAIPAVINGETEADFRARIEMWGERASSKGQMKRINAKREDKDMRTYKTFKSFQRDFPTMRSAAIENRILSA